MTAEVGVATLELAGKLCINISDQRHKHFVPVMSVKSLSGAQTLRWRLNRPALAVARMSALPSYSLKPEIPHPTPLPSYRALAGC
jgi:hypothetical protein